MPSLRPVVAVALAFLVVGCYTLQPTRGSAPQVGTNIAFDVNDAGRVALGGLIGPEIAQIEGRLLNNGTEDYLIAVSTVRLLRGGEQVWSGEQVRIKSEYVGTAYERRFSRGRSIALGSAVVGGFAAFLIGRSLVGAGQEGNGGVIDTAQTRIIRP
jgi:hypothetical protein